MQNEIEKLKNMRLEWHHGTEIGMYYCSAYDRKQCWLRMNDFPEEPMWTLYFKGITVDFDEESPLWIIHYITSAD